MKTNFAGEVIFEKKIKIQNRSTSGYKIFRIGERFILAGSTTNDQNTIALPFFLRIDLIGNIVFENIFSFSNSEYFADMQIINHNKYVVATSKDSGNFLLGKAIITDSLGNISYQRTFKTDFDVQLSSLVTIPNGDFIFAGTAIVNHIRSDEVGYAIRTDSTLLCKTVNIQNNIDIPTNDFILCQNYPNPFNPKTKIKFELSKAQKIDLKLIDITGKVVRELAKETKDRGTHYFDLDFGSYNLSSGIYFVQINGERGNSEKIKLIFLK
jgi:hypothetical protein